MKKYLFNTYTLFSFPFVLALTLAVFLVFELQFAFGDALSRSFHAYAVFFGNEPKFASIGFVWPPVPTLAALPFVLIKPLNTFGLVGNVMSALFLAITSIYLNKIFKFFNLTSVIRAVLLLLFILNPMMLFYGANGMSEMLAVCFFVATIYYLLSYVKKENVLFLIGASAATTLAIMTRYEMLALIPTIITLLVIRRIPHWKKINRQVVKEIEGDLMIYGLPIGFSISLWIIANWAIMDNPLYFMNSIYSNTSQASQLLNDSLYYRSLYHNIPNVLSYVGQRVIGLFPAFFLFTLVVLTQPFIKKNWKIIATILSLPFAIVLFHTFLLFQGQSFGWLRFFIYIIPATFILGAFLLKEFSKIKQVTVFTGIVLGLLVLSSLSSLHTMQTPEFGKEEHPIVSAMKTQSSSGLAASSYSQDLLIANYLNENVKDGKVILDDFMGFSIVYLSRNTNLFVETIDSDFQDRLENLNYDPEIKYILAHEPGGTGRLDAINIMYPTMFENGANMAVLVKDFGTWRLYKKTQSLDIL